MRTAHYTTPAADEVQLNYTIEAAAGSQLNGQPGVVFYPTEDYRKRQQKHGAATYPEPQPAK